MAKIRFIVTLKNIVSLPHSNTKQALTSTLTH